MGFHPVVQFYFYQWNSILATMAASSGANNWYHLDSWLKLEDMGGTTVLNYIPGVKFSKYTYTFNTPENIYLIFPQKFEQDSYFTSTTL